jgi:lipopolysaccharide transport system permease protein
MSLEIDQLEQQKDSTPVVLSTIQEPPDLEISPARGWFSLDLADLWHYRELIYFLTWRDVMVRYKQTALGAAWAVLQPLLTMILFSLIFGRFAGLPSDGLPYPIFTFTALIPWGLFAYALTQSSTSLVSDRNLITKIYFPRLVIPLSSVLSGLLDFAISLLVLFGMMLFFQVPITWRVLTLPLFVLLAVLSAVSVGLWLSALNVQYRDVRYTLPFLTQVWLFATPVAYSLSIVPENWRWLYSLNPMVGVVEGFRWALLGTDTVVGPLFPVSIAIILLLLFSGLVYFKRMEDNFADLV